MRLLRIFTIAGICFSLGNLQAQVTTSSGVVRTTTSFSGPITGIKGLPYSADEVHELTRILADGTRIQEETHGKSFRDSEGRTRTESEIVMHVGNGARIQHITIFDPIERVLINIDPKSKVAIIIPLPTPRTSAAKADSQKTDSQKMPKPADKSVYEHLGTEEIDGFSATGDRITRTIEIGQIGNDKPVVSVFETWTATDLKAVLRSKTDDPENGQRTMKLVNIQRDEPDPALFRIPEGYTVNDKRTNN
ncbi:MAG TPA: hypothetical protein VG759_22250 [Candidatus Angelobacter sp.]|nr:hypothetical protein [Candidatus Angelobacter sp.]